MPTLEGTSDSLRVVLAEDDPLTMFVLQQRLTNLGHQVVARASSGQEAVRQAALCQPDLVLMDVKMPEMDGIEAARAIRARTPAPIVLITAYSDEETVQRAQEAGVSAYLIKPVFDYQIKLAIEAAWEQTRSGDGAQALFRMD